MSAVLWTQQGSYKPMVTAITNIYQQFNKQLSGKLGLIPGIDVNMDWHPSYHDILKLLSHGTK